MSLPGPTLTKTRLCRNSTSFRFVKRLEPKHQKHLRPFRSCVIVQAELSSSASRRSVTEVSRPRPQPVDPHTRGSGVGRGCAKPRNATLPSRLNPASALCQGQQKAPKQSSGRPSQL